MRKLKITQGSGKMLRFQSINTNPLCNAYCEAMSKTDKICSECYSRAQLKTYRKSCVPSWTRNTKILSEGYLEKEQIPLFNDLAVRLHSHGELINKIHFENFLTIIGINPRTTFTLWTKRLGIINSILSKTSKPENLIMIYSNPDVDKPMQRIPKYCDCVFSVFTEEYVNNYNVEINCDGSCYECYVCYKENNVQFVNEYKKGKGSKSKKINKGGVNCGGSREYHSGIEQKVKR